MEVVHLSELLVSVLRPRLAACLSATASVGRDDCSARCRNWGRLRVRPEDGIKRRRKEKTSPSTKQYFKIIEKSAEQAVSYCLPP